MTGELLDIVKLKTEVILIQIALKPCRQLKEVQMKESKKKYCKISCINRRKIYAILCSCSFYPNPKFRNVKLDGKHDLTS